jgi:hypothetical protein
MASFHYMMMGDFIPANQEYNSVSNDLSVNAHLALSIEVSALVACSSVFGLCKDPKGYCVSVNII